MRPHKDRQKTNHQESNVVSQLFFLTAQVSEPEKEREGNNHQGLRNADSMHLILHDMSEEIAEIS